ncbi:aspartic peptidase A1 [Crucibulum laeve]|uniref:Aspartic peptidase A1 n=1 Tax=Crucibulum laeve TaxID=68775 RepID=A0A5C3M8R9_9AGAR|nr:aspartic peptidase A1 [Crucibulum laeve]
MQLKITFSVLLAGIFIALSTQDAEALPLSKRNNGMITLPLRRVEHLRSDVHPQIYLQQHINRGRRRVARMTGRAEPSSEHLKRELHKRVLAVEGPESLWKRYSRVGAGNKGSKTNGNALSASSSANGKNNSKNKAASSKGKKGNAAGNAANQTVPATPEIPAGVTAAGNPTAGDSLGLDIEAQDVGYLATVQMGTPPQDYLILMDSGSADLWVGSDNCQSSAGGGCGNHNFLGTSTSSSFVDTQKPFSITYGTGQVSGSIIQDNLAIAGLALPGHTFGVATTESVDFSDDSTPFDGLMGLAQSNPLSEQKTATPIEALATAGLVKSPITSYKISRLADGKNDGEITFGGTDPTKFDAATVTNLDNVSQQGFWEAAMDAVTVDGTDTGLAGRTAILDTGTTLIVAPATDAAAVHNLIPGSQSDGQGGFTVPCTTTASVALTFGGKSFAIEPQDIAFQPVDPNDPTGDCTSGITSGDVGGATEWLVGDVFLKNAYFSTDVAQNTLSLAKLV